jgi:HAD superfamily hydrolase (TIGR01509 family)
MGFAEIFDKSYCSALLGCKKPDQEFYQKIFKDLGNFKKEEILFWDDKIENVKGAEEFGIHAELYTTFENFEKVMKRYITE